MKQCRKSIFVGTYQFFCTKEEKHPGLHHANVPWPSIIELSQQHQDLETKLAICKKQSEPTHEYGDKE